MVVIDYLVDINCVQLDQINVETRNNFVNMV